MHILLNIVKFLDRDKFNPRILTMSEESGDSLKPDFEKMNVEIISFRLSKGKIDSKSKMSYLKILEDKKIDIIHSHGIRADTLAVISKTYIPTVSTLHNYVYYDYPMRYGKLKGMLMAYMHTKIIKKVDYPISCSESISKEYSTRKINTSCIQNGVDQQVYFPVETNSKITLRKTLGLPINKTIIISVGHMSKFKDPQTIIQGFMSSEHAEKEGHILVFLGDGPELDKCKVLARDKDNILFLGRVNNVVDYLRCADYFVSASLAEGLPNATLEALACGIPPILSDIHPHKEILGLNPNGGFIFRVGNSGSLSAVFNNLDGSKGFSNEALSIVENSLNAKNMSNQYQKLYKRISN